MDKNKDCAINTVYYKNGYNPNTNHNNNNSGKECKLLDIKLNP